MFVFVSLQDLVIYWYKPPLVCSVAAMELQQVLQESGAAGATDYLTARGFTSVALLARSAKDESSLTDSQSVITSTKPQMTPLLSRVRLLLLGSIAARFVVVSWCRWYHSPL